MPNNEEPEKIDSDDAATEDTIGGIFENIFAESCEDNELFVQGLQNLNSIPAFSQKPPPVKGKKFIPGYMGLRFNKSRLSLVIACGTAQVRYIDLPKYISMVENMHDPEKATIMLQNFQDQDDYKSAKGQILGRINPESSAIHVIQGLTGRIIHNPSDIALFDVYYLDRMDLTAFYLAAKTQVTNAALLEDMIATFEGWKAFKVPLDPLNPYTV